MDLGEAFKHKDNSFHITQLGLCVRQVPAATTQLQRKEGPLKELPQTFLQDLIFTSIETNLPNRLLVSQKKKKKSLEETN